MGRFRPPAASFSSRALGALRLDGETYAEVAGDDEATWQAVGVVVACVAVAVLAASPDLSGLSPSRRGGGLILAAGILALRAIFITILAWVALSVWAGLLAAIATFSLVGPETRTAFRRLLRALGFATAPFAFRALGFVVPPLSFRPLESVPSVGWLLGIAVSVWAIAAHITAIREALGVTTGRAIAVALGTLLVIAAVVLVVVILAQAA